MTVFMMTDMDVLYIHDDGYGRRQSTIRLVRRFFQSGGFFARLLFTGRRDYLYPSIEDTTTVTEDDSLRYDEGKFSQTRGLFTRFLFTG